MYEKTMPSMSENVVFEEPRRQSVCGYTNEIREIANVNLSMARAIRGIIDPPKEGNGRDERVPSCLIEDLELIVDILKMLNDELTTIQNRIS